MGVQLVAILAAVVIAAAGTAVILALVQATLGAKAGVREQLSGLDLSEHGEEAYFGEQGADSVAGCIARPRGDRVGGPSGAAEGRRRRLGAGVDSAESCAPDRVTDSPVGRGGLKGPLPFCRRATR